MTLYSIQKSTLTGIADALRRKVGDTEKATIISKISKTQNVNSFEEVSELNGRLPEKTDFHEIVIFKGASSIKIRASVRTWGNPLSVPETGRCLRVAAGSHDEMPTDSLIVGGGGEIKTLETVFEGTDTITLHFHCVADVADCYYAELIALNADGDEIIGEGDIEVDVPRTFKPTEMAGAVDSLGKPGCNGRHIPEEALTITGNCNSKFAYNGWNWFIEECGDEITTKDITSATSMFENYDLTSIPFDINLSNSSMANCSRLFYNCYKLTRLPYVKGKIGETSYLFSSLHNLREIPEDWADNIDWSGLHTSTTKTMSSTFNTCCSLRKIPANLMSNLWSNGPYYYSVFSSGFNSLYVLDEIKGMVPKTGAYTSNTFNNVFNSCLRVKDITFALQEDGTPYTVNWKKQTIDLTSNVGYAAQYSNITIYNSGITKDKQVTDDASYQALKNDPDWFATDIAYSRYNHDSAVNTINSLPITTNTGCSIKFKGESGSATDGGAINTLTEEEIAVAAAKGWTVTLT